LDTTNLQPIYDRSHALVIGINNYSDVPPLAYAVSDAKAVADILKLRFGFPDDNVVLLLNQDATKSSILKAYMRLTGAGTGINDRVLVFFAGHGHTLRSKRGDVGYLVPSDGNPEDLGSLVRWDELTRNADLIEAKHVFFAVDACYGGLAIMRKLSPGSTRFLKDMLLRTSRQVLTAGKADEPVSDSGGPLPDHSVFTGHFLEALGGKGMDSEGLITANGVMAYVYQMVPRDRDSHQTPHFGYLDGDGDMILLAPQLAHLQDQQEKDEDILVSVPAVLADQQPEKPMTVVEQTKELLTDSKLRIALHDLVSSKTREAMSLTADDHFPVSGGWSKEQFVDRLKQYETATTDLVLLQSLISYWGTDIHREILTLPIRRLCGRLSSVGGTVVWIHLRWYPALLLLYSGGIASIASENYSNLYSLFHAPIKDPDRSTTTPFSLIVVTNQMGDLIDTFKVLPGHERNFVSRSEYLFKFLQPNLDDLFFLGPDYESHFDRFEVLLALEYAHMETNGTWGPVGRFGWKLRHSVETSPFHILLKEAAQQGANWSVLKAGFFGGSLDRFNEVAKNFTDNVIAHVHWF
jgi:uncharacterized caspase-like protein